MSSFQQAFVEMGMNFTEFKSRNRSTQKTERPLFWGIFLSLTTNYYRYLKF